MIVDTRTLPDGFLIEADVCIVGAGAAGITIARELRGRPLRVALLESGWLTPDDATQSLYAGDSRGQPYFPLDAVRTRARYFGGATNEWAGECRPLDALDFEPRDWVPDSGWPFGLSELLPFYERAQVLCQLGRFAYAAADWHAEGVELLPLAGEQIRSLVLQYSSSRFGQTYRDDIARAGNVVAYLGANVVDLETPRPPTQVTGARIACLSGGRLRARARVFVLAGGGVENARLLLLANSVQPVGLGNAHEQVGRYFMEHLYVDRAATVLARAEHIGSFYTDGHWSGGRRIRGILCLSPQLQWRERVTNYCAVLDEEPLRAVIAFWRPCLRVLARGRVPADTLAHLRAVAPLLAMAAAARLKMVGPRRRGCLYRVKSVLEQAPNPESRVVLGEDRDQFGCPRVVLHWRPTALDRRTAGRAHQVLGEALRNAGVGRLRSSLGRDDDPWPTRLRGARHHMGTTRMHTDPRRGVVDPNGRVHGIANLYVTGSSVFPTSGSANPTLTIVALALRLADHLEARTH